MVGAALPPVSRATRVSGASSPQSQLVLGLRWRRLLNVDVSTVERWLLPEIDGGEAAAIISAYRRSADIYARSVRSMRGRNGFVVTTESLATQVVVLPHEELM